MIDKTEPYFGVFWGPRSVSFGETVTQVRSFLEGLMKIDPIFGTWYMLGSRMNAEQPLGDRLENLHSLMLERGWDKRAPKTCPESRTLFCLRWMMLHRYWDPLRQSEFCGT